MGVARIIMHPWCFAPSELPQNAIKSPIYDFVVQPWNNLETVVKAILMSVQSRGII